MKTTPIMLITKIQSVTFIAACIALGIGCADMDELDPMDGSDALVDGEDSIDDLQSIEDDGGIASSSCAGCITYEGTISSGDGHDSHPDGSYFYAPAGMHQGILSGEAGTDFDLHLWKWNGGGWTSVADSQSPDSNEEINYDGESGYYVWRVSPYSGSGSYQLQLGIPPRPELCGDGIDNDGDGAADCDDSDCADSPACAPAEDDFCGNYDGESIALRTDLDTYVRAGSGNTGYVVNQAATARGWEHFTVECQDDGTVAFATAHNRYIRAYPPGHPGPHIRQQTFVGSQERFTPIWQDDGTWAIQTAHGSYLRAHPNNSMMHQFAVGSQERFIVEL
ncbi:MAG: hypothetical protein AAF799_30555 [Myxococcota bacterium]